MALTDLYPELTELKSIAMTDEYAARHFYKQGWLGFRLFANKNEWITKIREKIAQEIEAELCECDCGEEHCFDNAIREAVYLARDKEWR